MIKHIEGTSFEVAIYYPQFDKSLPDTVEIAMLHSPGSRNLRVQSDLKRMGYSIQVWDKYTEEWEEINFVALTEEQQDRLDRERAAMENDE